VIDSSEINSEPFTVLITTSGMGSRLGKLTQYTNKSLIVVGEKPVLAQIIEKYPMNTSYVITLGYFGAHVKEFLKLCYPERDFIFVEVDPFDGPGSSLGYSIFCARNYLQKPFIFHACDTLVPNSIIPNSNSDWVAGFKGNDATNYATFDTQGNVIEKFSSKGMTDFDYIHIGLIGIKSYLAFWSELEKVISNNEFGPELNDVHVLGKLINKGISFEVKEFNDWIDIGNANSLVMAKKKLGVNFDVLEKPQESVSFVKDLVVKFFSEPHIVSERVKRAEYLYPAIPLIHGSSEHFFTYKFQDGKLLSNLYDDRLIETLLVWASENLWNIKPQNEISDIDSILETFYITKSITRLNELINTRSIRDENSRINNIEVPSAHDLIQKCKAELINEKEIGRFHGDFILDNILVSIGDFKLIDWRQDFAGSMEFADIYYDLAKLNHSLHINHSLVLDGHYFTKIDNDGIECGILRKDVHVEMEKHLKSFVQDRKLSWKKIQILTGLIWINMSPLHHHPFDKFLYYYGRYNLWKALND
jgi:choline kinase